MKLAHPRPRRYPGRIISHNPLPPVFLADHHRGVLDSGMGAQRRFNLPQLDPEPTDLDWSSRRPINSKFPSGRSRARSPVR